MAQLPRFHRGSAVCPRLPHLCALFAFLLLHLLAPACATFMLPLHARCAHGARSARCAPSLVCAGPAGRARCVRPGALGAACVPGPRAASHWPCAHWLSCVEGTCALPLNAPCAHAASQCGARRVCAGAPLRCRHAEPAGAVCGGAGSSTTRFCATGLMCNTSGRFAFVGRRDASNLAGVCVPKGRVASLGDDCGSSSPSMEMAKPGSRRLAPAVRAQAPPQGPGATTGGGGGSGAYHVSCQDGAVCAGPLGDRWCVAALPRGAWCGGPYKVCAPGLLCAEEKCHVALPAGARCGSAAKGYCAWGLVCAGAGGSGRRCVPATPPGGACGLDPEWKCEVGSVCRQGTCVLAV